MSGRAATTTFVAYLDIFSFDPVAIEFMFPFFFFFFFFFFLNRGLARPFITRCSNTTRGLHYCLHREHYGNYSLAHIAGPSRKEAPTCVELDVEIVLVTRRDGQHPHSSE